MPNTRLSPAERARFQHIEEKLYWTGAVAPSDLTRRWGITQAQAVSDLDRYAEQSDRSVYVEEDGFLIATRDYKPRLVRDISFDRFLHMVEEDSGFVDLADDLATLAPPQRPISTHVARALVRAIESEQDLLVSYLSMSSGPGDRWLAPHGFGHDGLRWHVRAFDYGRARFGDFVLSRIMDATDGRPRQVDVEKDRDWHDFVEITIMANPHLPAQKQKAIQRDYGMENGRALLRIRRAMLFYAADQLKLPLHYKSLPPEVRQVVPEDPDLLNQLLFEK